MSKLNRITRLGMLEDLRIHNDEVATAKHLLTMRIISPLAQVVLDYAFHISGIIDMQIVDRFESSDWPVITIEGHMITARYDNPCYAREWVEFRSRGMPEPLDIYEVHPIWNVIMACADNEYITYGLAGQLGLPRDSPIVDAAIKKLGVDMRDGYVTPA